MDTAITVLLVKITDKITADEALKYTQAALNLAHTRSILSTAKTEEVKQ
jgi:hypothetical protein